MRWCVPSFEQIGAEERKISAQRSSPDKINCSLGLGRQARA
jgi:hypothetical protein